LTSIKGQEWSGHCETIVIADCTDSDTTAVCDELLGPGDIFVRRNGPPGPSQSRNLGLSLAKGQTILFLDDDDAWYPGLLRDLAGSPNLTQGKPIYFNCSVVKERRLPNETVNLGETAIDLAGMLTDEIYVKNRIPNSCFAFPMQTLNGVFFDGHLRAYEDWDFVLAVLDRAKVVHEPIYGVRIFQVDDETTDRRSSTTAATDFNAVMDYLHIYRRHPAPSSEIQAARSKLMETVGLSVPPAML
jgi:glycosyltransferase involved in cell wall biosynthesis